MTRFLSDRLDLDRLRAIDPSVIQGLDFEAIKAARIAKLKELWPTWDQGALETDPAVILQEVDAYRELLDHQSINEGFRAILPVFARGIDLDHIAARAGVLRLDGEADDDLRMRYFASFGAPSAGSEDAYVYAALTAAPSLRDVAIIGPDINGRPGDVDVVLLANSPEPTPSAVLSGVRAAVHGRSVRPLTDVVTVHAATIVPYTASLTVYAPRDADVTVMREATLTALATITSGRFYIGSPVPKNALAAAGFACGADEVTVNSPAADIGDDPYSAPYCASLSVEVIARF